VEDSDYKVASYRRRFPSGRKKTMNTPSLGIDMAQLSFSVALWFDSQRCVKSRFDNTPHGFRQLGRWLRQHFAGQVRAALESTNTYAEPLAQWLYEAGHQVHVLNPERIAHYARSLGQRNKTDPADAVTIARYIATHEATVWKPAPPEQLHLRSLTRTRHQLVTYSNQLRNQLQTADPVARPHLQAVLDTIAGQLKAILREISTHLRRHPQLGDQVRRLMTCKGVGLITAAITLAELPPVTAQSDPRALCAWAGLTPKRWQSGNTEWPARLCRKGNVYLRQALYMPALVAKRYNPLLRLFAQRLAQKGKSTPAILGAISHKMLRILIGLLRSQTDFDPHWSLQEN
jgi:transposase